MKTRNLRVIVKSFFIDRTAYYVSVNIIVLFFANMYPYFVLLSVLIHKSMGTIFRKHYQDESSWAFKHPTNRYEKLNINGRLVKTLTTIPMDASSIVRYLLDSKINYVSCFIRSLTF